MTTSEQTHGDARHMDDPRTVLHWYDFLCPFCYVGQHRTAILVRHVLQVVELPFQAHADIAPGGTSHWTDVRHAGARGERSRIATAVASAPSRHAAGLG